MNPNAQVADLIMQLMSRGRSGGMPMNASPELTQYLAHAKSGTTPPQQRGAPSAQVFDPGGNLDPRNFGAGNRRIDMAPPQPVDPRIMAEMSDPNFLNEPSPLDMVGAPRPSPGAGAMGDAGQTFIWMTNPTTGKRVRLDGPFTDDIQAARAMRELREAGMSDELEISPY